MFAVSNLSGLLLSSPDLLIMNRVPLKDVKVLTPRHLGMRLPMDTGGMADVIC